MEIPALLTCREQIDLIRTSLKSWMFEATNRDTCAEMKLIGLSHVEPTAGICWPDWFGPSGRVEAGGEMGPWAVPEALTRAEELRAQFGFPRVVVTMEERGI